MGFVKAVMKIHGTVHAIHRRSEPLKRVFERDGLLFTCTQYGPTTPFSPSYEETTATDWELF